jgi:hypothetical protein
VDGPTCTGMAELDVSSAHKPNSSPDHKHEHTDVLVSKADTPTLGEAEVKANVETVATVAEEDVSQAAQQSANAKTGHWKPYQDRALAKEVEAARPFEAERGRVGAAWAEIGKTLEGVHGVKRTGEACKNRFAIILDKHRVCLISLNYDIPDAFLARPVLFTAENWDQQRS